MSIEKLSDFQLYALVVNPNFEDDITLQAKEEFFKRNFSQKYIDELSLKFEGVATTKKTELTIFNKYLIIALPFFLPIQAIIASRYDVPDRKIYWKYMAIGYALWTTAFLLWYKLAFPK